MVLLRNQLDEVIASDVQFIQSVINQTPIELSVSELVDLREEVLIEEADDDERVVILVGLVGAVGEVEAHEKLHEAAVVDFLGVFVEEVVAVAERRAEFHRHPLSQSAAQIDDRVSVAAGTDEREERRREHGRRVDRGVLVDVEGGGDEVVQDVADGDDVAAKKLRDGACHGRNVRGSENVDEAQTGEDDALGAAVAGRKAVADILDEEQLRNVEAAERNFRFVEVANERKELACDAPDGRLGELFAIGGDVLERAASLDETVFEEDVVRAKREFGGGDDGVQLGEVGVAELAKILSRSGTSLRRDSRTRDDTTDADQRAGETVGAAVDLGLVRRNERRLLRILFHQGQSRIVGKFWGRGRGLVVRAARGSVGHVDVVAKNGARSEVADGDEGSSWENIARVKNTARVGDDVGDDVVAALATDGGRTDVSGGRDVINRGRIRGKRERILRGILNCGGVGVLVASMGRL